MDLLTSSPSAYLAPPTDNGLMSSNLMSFNSPSAPAEKVELLKPEGAKPCNLQLQQTSSPFDQMDPTTSTPFEGEPQAPVFVFEANKETAEDPFELVERQALQDANDPFEMVIAAASKQQPSLSDSIGSKGSMMNNAFENSTVSSTGLTADFENLQLASGDAPSIPEKPQPQEELKPPRESNDDEEWLSDELPPWETQKTALDDPLKLDSDSEEEVFNTVRRASIGFPKIVASLAEELDTSIVNQLKLNSPVLKKISHIDLSPPAEPLEVPAVGLRSIDLSFLDSNDSEQITPAKDEMDDWKKMIMEKASGFSKSKTAVSSKPFSQPLVQLDVNSPKAMVSTPVRKPSALPKSNLPTPKFKSRLMKPRNYGANKENV